jgi:hypothetical protein
MVINDFLHPRRVGAINDYYELGHARKIYSADKQKTLNFYMKQFSNTDIRKAFVDIHHRRSGGITISPEYFKKLEMEFFGPVLE